MGLDYASFKDSQAKISKLIINKFTKKTDF